jgi:hypothetical protein
MSATQVGSPCSRILGDSYKHANLFKYIMEPAMAAKSFLKHAQWPVL